MAVPSNLYQKASLKGDREDLIDKIFNTSPTEAPVVSSIGRTTATNTFHEWQRDSLAAANADNAAIDGDDASMEAQTPTERVGNYMQIFRKVKGVSRRANIVKKAGRGTEMAYIKAQAMLEIKRDIEAMVLSNNAAVAPTTSVAGKSAGLGVQSYANAFHNGAGATAAWTAGAPTTAVTAGTNRTFTEALLKTACQNVYTNSGGVASMVVMSPSHKALFSAFAGIAQNRLEVKGKNQGTIIGAADVYVSDFGALEIVPHYLMAGATDVHLLNTDYLDLAVLDGFKTEPLAKTGDSEKVMIITDCALAVRAPKAIAKLSNLTP
jgi:hypothetical protein